MTWHTEAYRKDLERHKRWQRMDFHHFHYAHLSTRGGRKPRYSIMFWDGCYIPDWLHVPVIHKLLGGGGGGAGRQRFGKFPNPAQRCAHWILRFVMPFVYLLTVLKIQRVTPMDFIGASLVLTLSYYLLR